MPKRYTPAEHRDCAVREPSTTCTSATPIRRSNEMKLKLGVGSESLLFHT